MIKSCFKATGSYLPEKIITNFDLEKQIETSDEWIFSRTGISQRHIAKDDEFSSDMAKIACENAIENSDISKDEIDLILVATTTPDLTFPSTATILQKKLGIKAVAFDIQAVCAGFIYALTTADSFIKSKQFETVMVVGVDKMSSIVDWQDRSTSVLFGDGAGAVILQATKSDRGILSSNIYSDGNFGDILKTTGGVSSNKSSGFVYMQGQDVFKHAVSKMSESVKTSLQDIGLEVADIDHLIPHQANERIIEMVGKKLKISQDKVTSTVAKTANTSAASIPIALDHANKETKLKQNQIIALTAIGGGLTWGSSIIRW